MDQPLTSDPMLVVKDLHVSYGELKVIQGVNLAVHRNEIIGLVGPNGHGKTTFLKCVCGLMPADSGSVVFKDEDVSGLRAPGLVDRGLVYVAEERNLFRQMTVLENLALGAYNRRARRQRDKSFDFVYSLFPRLKERRNQVADTLSGGEAQMLALGRGIMSCADFMAIDEPSLGLAPNLAEQMLNTISGMAKSGITVLLVEQSLTQLEGIVDRVYFMEDGIVEPIGRNGDKSKENNGALSEA